VSGRQIALKNKRHLSLKITVFGHQLLLFDLSGCIATTCMLFMVIHLTARHTAQLFHQEPFA
jgi:archaetidylinositol phosphate synthase